MVNFAILLMSLYILRERYFADDSKLLEVFKKTLPFSIVSVTNEGPIIASGSATPCVLLIYRMLGTSKAKISNRPLDDLL